MEPTVPKNTDKPVSELTMSSAESSLNPVSPDNRVDSGVSGGNSVAPRRSRSRIWYAVASVVVAVLIIGLGAWLFWNQHRDQLVDRIKPTSLTLDAQSSPAPSTSNKASELAINGDLRVGGKLALSAEGIANLVDALGNKVTLQASFPGTLQAGNVNVTGTVGAGLFSGSGAGLTNISATAVTTGQLANDRLSSQVTLLGQSIPLAAFQANVLSSLNGVVNNGGNIDIVGGPGVTITADATGKTITVDAASASGDITAVIAGIGLTGGGTSGNVTLDLDSSTVTLQGNTFNGASQLVQLNGSGALPVLSGVNVTNLNASNIASGTLSDARLSAAVTVQGNVFNAANQLVQLNGSGALPVVSGANLTNLNATNIASGTINDARLSTAVTLLGNVFNGPNQLTQLDGSGALPAISGTNLTNLNAGSVTSGTLSDSRLSANVTVQGNTFNLPNKLVLLNGSGALPSLNGSNLTNLNASALSSGTVSDAYLSANVALLNANQNFTGSNTFTGTVYANAIQPTASMTIGATAQSLTLQGNLSTQLTATSGGNIVAIGFSGVPTGNVTYAFDAATTPGSYGICTTVGNCASVGGGVTTLGGSTNKLVKFTGSQSIGDSSIADTGTAVTVTATGKFQAGSNSTTAFQIQDAAGTSNLFVADTTNTRIAIGQATASYPLDVAGDINSTTGLRVGGNLVCNASGCAAASSSGFYIQNGTSLQTAANFNIESTSTSSVVGILKGKISQTADIFRAVSGPGTTLFSVGADGSTTINASSSVNALLVTGSSSENVLRVDSNNNVVVIGNTDPYGSFKSVISSTGSGIGGLAINPNAAGDYALAVGYGGTNTIRSYITGGGAAYFGPANSTSAFQIQNSAGNSNLFIADTSNTRIGIGKTNPGYTLDVNGDINIASGSSYRINGVAICGPSATCAPDSGSSSYIQNGSSLQAASNFYIQSASAAAVGGVIRGAASQSANLFEARDGSNNTVLSISPSAVLTLGTQSAYNGQLVLRNTSNANTTTLGAVTPTSNRAINLPDEAGTLCIQSSANCGFALSSGSGNYIQNGTTLQTGANFNIESSATNAVTGVLKAVSGQTANIFEARNSAGNPVYSLGPNGDSLYKTTTNSTSGFQIQNSAGNNLFAIDTTNSKATFNSTANGEVNAWTTNANAVTSSTGGSGTSIYNGFMYTVVGGATTVTYARVNSSGSIATAVSTAPLPSSPTSPALLTYNGYIYMVPGGGTVIRYARINTDGTIGDGTSASWGSLTATSGALPNNPSNQVVINNGFLYAFGTAPSSAGIYYGRLNADGTVTSWSSGSLPQARISAAAVVANGYVLILGGSSDGLNGLTSNITAKLNTDGSVGAFSTTTAFGSQTYLHSAAVINGYVYVMGGSTASGATNGTANVYYGRVSSTGTIPSWTLAANVLPAARVYGSSTATANGYIYYSGGQNTSSVAQTTLYYTSGARIQMIGSLDLIGLGGGDLSDAAGNAGGTIYAGKIYSNSDLEIAGNSQLNGGLAVGGVANFRPVANSTSSFQIQNASGANLVNVDSTNSQISFNGGFNGETKAWTTNANALPAGLASPGTAIVNGYIYAIGGMSIGASYSYWALGGAGSCTIRYAKLNADGSIGTWSSATSSLSDCPSAANAFASSAVAVNGRIYVSIGNSGTISSFKPNADGNVTGTVEQFSWLSCMNGRYPRGPQSLFAANGFLYTNGGYDVGYTHLTRMALNSATGTISGCTDVDLVRGSNYSYGSSSVVANGYLYTIGGDFTNCLGPSTQVRKVKINQDGTFGSETTTTALPVTMAFAGAVYSNGYLYVIGGAANVCATANYNTVYYARVNSDGTVGTWNTSTNTLPVTRSLSQSQVYNGYIYSIGGANTTTGSQTGVYYTSTARVQINASLDLVGDLGSNPTNESALGQAGGSITAGKINALGGLDVLGNLNSFGTATFGSQNNSMTAFQIQNASAAALFTVDTTNGKLQVNNTVNGELNTWGSAGTAGAATSGSATTVVNGYLYSIGGTGATTSVYSQRINGDGTLGTATSTTAITAVAQVGAASYNGFIYVAGNAARDVYYAKATSGGTVGAWTTIANALPAASQGQNQVAVANGYFYLFGGGATGNAIYYAKINPDGSLGAFSTATATLGTQVIRGSISIVNGYAIYIGGSTVAQLCTSAGTGASATVYSGALNASTGDIASMPATTALPVNRCGHSTVVSNGFIYVLGGATTNAASATSTVYYARVSSTGTIPASGSAGYWTAASSAITAGRFLFQAQEVNGNIYVPGGMNTSSAGTSTIYYASGARLQLNASLDLVGAQTGGLTSSAGSNGGSIYAGKIFSNSTLEITGQSLLNGGASITGDLVGKGYVNFRPITDSTTAFVVQNAAGSSTVLAVDSTNLKVTVQDLAVNGHIITTGATPSIAANAGAGTTPTISIAGTDTAGAITLTTGTTPTVSADVLTVTFAAAYPSAPRVVFSPANANSALLNGNAAVYVTPATGTFKLTTGSAGLTAATQYIWSYHVIQ